MVSSFPNFLSKISGRASLKKLAWVYLSASISISVWDFEHCKQCKAPIVSRFIDKFNRGRQFASPIVPEAMWSLKCNGALHRLKLHPGLGKILTTYEL
jgi:hypothetical protein